MLGFGRRKKKQPESTGDGLFMKCDGCASLVYRKNVAERMHTCPECDHHFRVGAWDRVKMHTDEDTFQELDGDLLPCDPLEFVAAKAYKDQLEGYAEKSGLNEAIICGTCTIEDHPAVFTAMDFRFCGASMGSVVGEKLARAAELACERKLPLVTVAASGGARMQEGSISLVQMAKTCAALNRLDSAGGVHISVMTDPTTGGVWASWAAVGDVILAEPGATIRFAGARVIEETIKGKLPDGFATSEFLLEHGFLDMIVDRRELKRTLGTLISYLT